MENSRLKATACSADNAQQYVAMIFLFKLLIFMCYKDYNIDYPILYEKLQSTNIKNAFVISASFGTLVIY